MFVSAGDEPPFEIVLLQRRRLAAGLLRTALHRPEEAERRLQVSNREPHRQSCRRQHSPPPANTKCQAPQATYCPGTASLINTMYISFSLLKIMALDVLRKTYKFDIFQKNT